MQSALHRALRPALQKPIGGGRLRGYIFDPADISGLIQRFGDMNPGYHGSTLGGLPILNAEESGTLALPHGQHTLQGDGINDFAISASNIGITGAANRTVCFRFKAASTVGQTIFSFGAASGGQLFAAEINSNKWYFHGWAADIIGPNADTNWHSHALTYDGTTVRWYIDGTLSFSGNVALNTAASVFNLLIRPGGSNHSAGQISNVRVYNVAKTAGEALAIANQHLTPSTIDTAGLIGLWWLNEESGSIAYDSWGNNDLTLTNGPTWTTDAGVNYNPANWLGHTVSGNVVIPRNESNTSQDAAGNALGVTGPLKHPATTEVRCVTGDGSAAYAVSGSNIGITGAANRTVCFRAKLNSTSGTPALLSWGTTGSAEIFSLMVISSNWYFQGSGGGNDLATGVASDTNWHHHAISYNGTTLVWYIDGVSIASAARTLSTGSSSVHLLQRFDGIWQANASICDVRIYSDVKTLSEVQAINSGTDNRTNLVAHWTGQEGPGTSNTNRTIYDTVGSNHLTLVNGTVSTIWANYCPYAQDWCVNNGGGIAANGAFIPGRIGTGLDALGNAKTLAAGEQSNTSNIVPNFWGTPELNNVGISASTKWARTTSVQATSPANTKFRNTVNGTKNLVYQDAKSGADKLNIENYVNSINGFSLVKRAIANGQSTSLLVWGDSTGNDSTTPREWPWLLADKFATENPNYTVHVRMWNDAVVNWNSAVVIQTGIAGLAAPIITIWNYSIAGVGTHYSLGERWTHLISLNVDGLIINHGHNHVAGVTATTTRGEFLAAIESYREAKSGVPISAIIQNPRQDSTVMDLAVQCWRETAALRNIGLINAHDPFVAQGKILSLYLAADTVHPSATAQLDIILAEVWKHYTEAKQDVFTPITSTFAQTVTNLVPNGRFLDYPTSPGLPTSWTAGGSGTLTAEKELSIVAAGRPHSVKLTATTNTSRMNYNLTAPEYTALRGQWVTLAAKRYVPTGAGANVGRLQIFANSASAGNPFVTTRPYVLLQAGFVWWVISGFFVPADATSLSIRLIHDTTLGVPSTSPCYWDQCCLVTGLVPYSASN